MRLTTKSPTISTSSLNTWNKRLAVLHAVQGILVLILSKGVSWPITTSFLTQDSIASKIAERPVLAPAAQVLFNVNLAHLVATFFFMSAIAHIVVATRGRKTYEADLKKGINKFRWIEYGFSASTMIVAIGVLTGVYDLSSLLMMFVLTLVMNLLGLVMELKNQTNKQVDWLPFWVGTLAGIVPWIVLAIYFIGANVYGSGGIPTFVYFIYGSLFVFFGSFAVNMYLQYKKTGKWSNYLYGERTYMVLSLVAKSALAWQVFAGALRP
ncbi:hypothetical protein EKI60_03540 [Candidatus Saccharibacteria bacterium]|nr:MAG: hypothetical protein EKI60_03540 [Candidatus Saccharibacteria bacterium]